jgi:uncharacterized protein YigA (DUF484 family)
MKMSMNEPISEDEVAQFIQDNPDLFRRRPSLLGCIDLPDPHDGRAVSLGERQAQILRERIRSLEARLAEFVRNGRDNDAIDERLARWTGLLLAERDEQHLPEVALTQLKRIFEVPSAALRLWSFAPRFAALACAAPVSEDVIRFAASMQAPFCGPNAEFEAAGWLQSDAAGTRSLALIPLRAQPVEAPFGMLTLGSADPLRFRGDMGTAFLGRIGDLAAAALSRLRR